MSGGLLWNLFGNEDDGDSGERSFEPGYDLRLADPEYIKANPHLTYAPLIQPDWWRRICWTARNPAHNLMFYTWRKPDGWFINTPIGYIGHRPNKPVPGVEYTQDQLDWLAKRDGVFGAALFRKYG